MGTNVLHLASSGMQLDTAEPLCCNSARQYKRPFDAGATGEAEGCSCSAAQAEGSREEHEDQSGQHALLVVQPQRAVDLGQLVHARLREHTQLDLHHLQVCGRAAEGHSVQARGRLEIVRHSRS